MKLPHKLKALLEQPTTDAMFVALAAIAQTKCLDLGVVTRHVDAFYLEITSIVALMASVRAHCASKFRAVRGDS
jgi:hypothetical protein